MKLARVNTLLVILIVIVNIYVIALPFLPAVLFTMQKNSRAAQLAEVVTDTPSGNPISADAEQLVIPAMALDTPILESSQKNILDKGIWRLPHTSTPDRGSNTVMVAHRFTYTNPRGTFYHLDKVKPGDPIAVLWHGKKYIYRVYSVGTVKPDRVEIERATNDPQLTLYTCTPLWNPKERLVVTANLEAIR